ncbi:MAG: glycosyltransferase, partial [Candidatus Methylomirabilales bacterium]
MGDYATARKLSGDPGPVWVPDRLVFFCVLVRGSLLAALGGLSEDYGLGNFEDDDFCIRTRMRGFLLAVDPMSFVFHHGSLTWTREGLSHPEWMRRNREVFYRKVAEYSTGLEEFSGHKAPGRAGASRRDAVSVIVRTLNRPHLLGQALASLANQTLDAFEVVVVNDAGCNVGHLVEKFSSRLNIKYVAHEVAQGRSASLNSGLSAATGRWIAYLDDDDIVYPLHLELLLGAVSVAEDPVAYALVHTVLSRHSEDGDILLARRPFALFEFSPDELLVQNRIPILSIMHSAECLERVGGFDESLHILEDWDFMIRLSQRFRFRQIEKVTSEYR